MTQYGWFLPARGPLNGLRPRTEPS